MKNRNKKTEFANQKFTNSAKYLANCNKEANLRKLDNF